MPSPRHRILFLEIRIPKRRFTYAAIAPGAIEHRPTARSPVEINVVGLDVLRLRQYAADALRGKHSERLHHSTGDRDTNQQANFLYSYSCQLGSGYSGNFSGSVIARTIINAQLARKHNANARSLDILIYLRPGVPYSPMASHHVQCLHELKPIVVAAGDAERVILRRAIAPSPIFSWTGEDWRESCGLRGHRIDPSSPNAATWRPAVQNRVVVN